MEQGEEKESGASVINYAERKETKNRLKRQLYQLLCAYTGQTLPWGTLTGIRPAKIAMGLIEQGMSNVETAEYMRNTYLASNGMCFEILTTKMATASMWGFRSAQASAFIAPSHPIRWKDGGNRWISIWMLYVRNWIMWQTGSGIKSLIQSISAVVHRPHWSLISWTVC